MPLTKIFVPLLALLAAASPFDTALADETDKRTISLSATGTVKASPDTVTINTGVKSESKTAKKALDKNTKSMTKVVNGLKEAGIAPEDIQTSEFSVTPVYEGKGYSLFSGSRGRGELKGFYVTNAVRVVVRDTDKLGKILDTAVQLGANQINSIRFDISEPETLQDEARRQAMRNATDNAKLYAEAAGVELGPVITIVEEHGGHVPRGVRTSSSKSYTSKSVSIEAGTTAIKARIRVTWELR